MSKSRTKSGSSDATPRRTWSVSVADLGDAGLALRQPLTVMLEDFGEEYVASWPEVEAWGTGPTEADAINSFKDELSSLYGELAGTPDRRLGKLPMRWKRALFTVAYPTGLASR